MNVDPSKKTKGLLNDYTPKELDGMLVIARDVDNTATKQYTVFKSYIDFGRMFQMTPVKDRNFYEIISGTRPQRVYFDIDIEIDNQERIGEEVKDNLIDVLKAEIPDLIPNRDIVVLSSHSNKKESYHIILRNHSTGSNLEAQALSSVIHEKMSPEYSKYIDRSVYSKNRCFRIIGSSKRGKNTPLLFEESWLYRGEKMEFPFIETPIDLIHRYMLHLEASLITQTVGTRILEPRTMVLPPKPPMSSEDLNEDQVKGALTLYAGALGYTLESKMFPYTFTGSKGNIIVLRRNRPAICLVCNRKHDSENPYLTVTGPKDYVNLYCRRAISEGRTRKSFFLGTLKSDLAVSTEKEEEEEEEPLVRSMTSVGYQKNLFKQLYSLT